MKKHIAIVMLLLIMGSSSILNAEGRLTVYTKVDADLYVNEVKQASVNPVDPFILQLKEPGDYKIQLKAKEGDLVHQEDVTLVAGTGLEKTIRAFEDYKPAAEKPAAQAAAAEPGITRAELKAEIAKAKSEALAEEAARRKRQQERELGKKALIHVVGVETQRVPSGVKNIERLKLLGDLIPSLTKK